MATYYVATTGNDGNAGTIGSPFLTLNHGVSVLVAGDTLFVRAGDYDESLIYNIPSGTSWNNKVRIAAYPGETVWMNPTSGNYVIAWAGDSSGGNVGEQKYIEIDGVNIDGDNGILYTPIVIEAGDGYNAHHIRLQNLAIHNNEHADEGQEHPGTAHCILVTGRVADAIGANEFINLHCSGGHADSVGEDWSNMVYIQTPDNVVDGCLIEDGIGSGVQIYNSSPVPSPPHRNVVKNCIIRNFTKSSGTRSYGIVLGASNDCVLYNNLIYNIAHTGSPSCGIYVFTGDNHQLYNNTVYGNALAGIRVEDIPYATNTILTNNIAYGSPTNYDPGDDATLTTNLFGTDPSFVNAATGNFMLLAGSVARDTGTNVGVVTADITGVPRTNGSYDIGAYEFVSGTPTSYSDPFNGADEELAAPWLQWRPSTPMMLTGSGGEVEPPGENVNAGALYTSPVSADQFSQIVPQFTGPGNGTKYVYLMVRASNTVDNYLGGNGYWFWSDGGSDTQVMVYTSGAASQSVLSTDDTFTFAAGNTIKFEAIGTALKIYKNGTVVSSLNATDATLTTGLPGFGGYGNAGTVFDNWAGGDVEALVETAVPVMSFMRRMRVA